MTTSRKRESIHTSTTHWGVGRTGSILPLEGAFGMTLSTHTPSTRTSSVDASRRVILRVGGLSQLGGLDVRTADDSVSSMILCEIFEPLYGITEADHLEPVLADAMPVREGSSVSNPVSCRRSWGRIRTTCATSSDASRS